MCGKGIIFIESFHMIRVLSNFDGRAGFATFPARPPPPPGHMHTVNPVEIAKVVCFSDICLLFKLLSFNVLTPNCTQILTESLSVLART